LEKFSPDALQENSPDLYEDLFWKYMRRFNEEMDRAKKEGINEDVGPRMFEIYRYVCWNIGFHSFLQGYYEGVEMAEIPKDFRPKEGKPCRSKKAKAKNRSAPISERK